MLHLDTELSSHKSCCDCGGRLEFPIGASACLSIMGSGQSVPKDSPLACVIKNLKRLSLTELKANRLKQFYTQIWPQYQLDNQDCWPEVGTLTLTFSKISLTSLKGMTSGRRSPMPKPLGPLGAGPPCARPAPPTRSFYAPCLPSGRALLPQLTADQDLTHPRSSTPRTDEPPPYPPPRRPSPSPSPNSPTGPETSPDSPSALLPYLPDSSSPLSSPPATQSCTQHMFSLRDMAGPEGPTQVHVPFSLSDMSPSLVPPCWPILFTTSPRASSKCQLSTCQITPDHSFSLHVPTKDRPCGFYVSGLETPGLP